jgi:hypothetical protein
VTFQELGGVEATTRSGGPSGKWFELGVGGGDIPYWSSHPELNRAQVVTYAAQTKNEGQVFFSLYLIHFKREWELRNFFLRIPASRPGARQFILELARKLVPSAGARPGRASL